MQTSKLTSSDISSKSVLTLGDQGAKKQFYNGKTVLK